MASYKGSAKINTENVKSIKEGIHHYLIFMSASSSSDMRLVFRETN